MVLYTIKINNTINYYDRIKLYKIYTILYGAEKKKNNNYDKKTIN